MAHVAIVPLYKQGFVSSALASLPVLMRLRVRITLCAPKGLSIVDDNVDPLFE